MKKIRATVYLATILNNSFNFASVLLASLLVKVSGVPVEEAALMLGFAYLISGMIQPQIGAIVDLNKYRLAIFIVIFGNFIGISSLLFGSRVILYMGIVALVCSSGTMQTLTSKIIEGMASDEERIQLGTTNYITMNIGLAISAAIGFFFLEEYKITLLALDFVTVAISGYLMLKCLQRSSASEFTKAVPKNRKSLGSWLNPQTLLLILISSIPYAGMAASFSAMQLQFQDLGLDVMKYSTLLIGENSLICAFSGVLLKKINPSLKFRYFIGTALLGLGLFLILQSRTLWQCMLYTGIWAIGEILMVGVLSNSFFVHGGREHAGRSAGAKVLSMRISFMICPLVFMLARPLTIWSSFLVFALPIFFAGWILFRMMENSSRNVQT